MTAPIYKRPHKFEYGPVSLGVFKALLWGTALVGFIAPVSLTYYVAFLLFLAFGLRPLIERTGLFEYYQHFRCTLDERLNRKQLAQRDQEIERKRRDDRYRHARRKDPRLPKNW
ncbi:hypothetical protein MIB92_14325 [Aestuariirhabdus sp. Z084]|uniref:hypothetical protein n=1 Tax=Aestuariirhabdus haliotis TaxID=2918751 RepID=UPI00201B4419|nr:hypothetical protein [Aestuariirhabdus haliotis]MCL6416833.1 hypothetical protein [Aestuariirhabdus haliotis]MCL6420833.1 hypothetical protein [Aestuariirhabdus haliotis]